MKVKIVKSNMPFFDDMNIGIHLLNPSEKEIESTIEDALLKSFKFIFIHTSN
jgi:hypothetical protein